jgi:hypothetical protein
MVYGLISPGLFFFVNCQLRESFSFFPMHKLPEEAFPHAGHVMHGDKKAFFSGKISNVVVNEGSSSWRRMWWRRRRVVINRVGVVGY